MAVLIVTGCYESLSDLESSEPQESGRSSRESLDTWWSSLSQVQRNQAIITRGLQQIGQVTGQQCKEWARTVVLGASQGNVVLPPTRANGWQWYSNSHVRLVAQNVCPANLLPGHIVQLRQGNGLPHTAMVYAISQTGMTWLDANWVNYNNPVGTVALHVVTWTQFYQMTNRYSFYEIIG